MGFLLCFLVLAVTGGVSAVQVVNGRLGGSIYFYESISIKEDPLIIWSSAKGPVGRFFAGESRCYAASIGRCQMFGNGTLKLDRLALTDDGTYSMTAENSTLIEEAKYQLRVYASLPVNETVGGSAYLYIPDPLPTAYQILWYFNINSLMALLGPGSGPVFSAPYRGRCELFRNGTLRLDNLTQADQGEYTVLVQNTENVSSKDFHYQLYIDGATSDIKFVNGRVGETIYFYQSFSEINDPIIDWQFNYKRAAFYYFELYGSLCYAQFYERCEVFPNGTLRVDNLISADEGMYSMEAGDRYTVYASAQYKLRIYSSLSSQKVGGILGGVAYLVLPSTLPTDSPISIYFNGNTLIALREPGSTPSCSTAYRGRCELFTNGTLKLDNLTYADQGNYTVFIQDLNNVTSVDYHYQLEVYGPLTGAVLRVNSTSNYIVNGTYVSLHCDRGNQAVTKYTFYHEQRNICADPHVTCRDSNLYFQPINVSQRGNYTCTIENLVSSTNSHTLQLIVSVPVSDVSLITNTSSLVWPGIDTVSLHCSAKGTDVSFSWSLQGSPLPEHPRYQLSHNKTILTISPLEIIDKGPFICTASNWINRGPSKQETLNMASEVSSLILTSNATGLVHVGVDALSLYCSSQGTSVSFTWRLRGQQVHHEDQYHIVVADSPPNSNLTIKYVSKNDTGPFTCKASNRINHLTSQELTFNLAWNPEEPMNCLVEPVGQNVKIGCSWLGGQPAANVSLSFNGVTEEGQEMLTKTVTLVKLPGSNLTCHGSQLESLSNCTVIFEPPHAPEHDNSSVTKTEAGDTVNFTVSLISVLPSVFTWYHLNPDAVPIPGARELTVESTPFTSNLRISNVAAGDAGKYECRAVNIIGSQSFLFSLSVNNPDSPGLNGGEIAGIVIGVLAGLAMIGVLVFFILRKRSR